MTEDELDAELARPGFPDLVGVSEIAGILQPDDKPVSRQRASAVTKRQIFPRPVTRARLGARMVKNWVRNFVETCGQKPAWPKATVHDTENEAVREARSNAAFGGGVVVHRRDGSVSAVSSDGQDPKSVQTSKPGSRSVLSK